MKVGKVTQSASRNEPPGRAADGAVDPERVIAALRRWLEARHFVSHDPYDGLTSPYLRSVFGVPILARLCLQAVKRSPLDLRPLLRIRPALYTKSLSDLASAYLRLYKLEGEPARRTRALDLLQQLERRSLSGFPGRCWGMDLPYVTRFAIATPATPNLFQTVNAATAFLDGYELEGTPRWLAIASEVVEFLEVGLGRLVDDERGVAWRYYPDLDGLVYNVNALAAAFLARLAALAGREDWAALSRRAMAFVVAAQNADGSWFYAHEARGHWIDGFHTGYVLESLLDYGRLQDDPAARAALERGCAFFRERLLDASGLPRYTDRSLYPIEVQNCAEAVQLLSKLAAREPEWLPLAERAWAASAQKLLVWDDSAAAPTAHLSLQRGRWLSSKLISVRWGMAPMLLALAWLRTAQTGAVPEIPEQ